MDKIDKILRLISEKSDALYENLSDLNAKQADIEDTAEVVGQIAILTELYKEVELIRAEDD